MTTLDAGGVDVGVSDPFPPDGSGTENGGAGEFTKTVPFIIPIEGGGAICNLDGLDILCSRINGNSSVQCANNDCNATVTLVGRAKGQVVATWVEPAPEGWDPSYDGTYVFNDGLPWRRKGGDPASRRSGSQMFNHVIFSAPQSSGTEDNPDELQSDNNGKDCGVVVTFKPGTSNKSTSLPNGPSTITYNGGPNFGLGFSVSGWVGDGGIGTIGVDSNTGKKVTNPANPKGRWSLAGC
jgi:hypothetical protein